MLQPKKTKYRRVQKGKMKEDWQGVKRLMIGEKGY